ncbi:ABC transporter permease [Intestinibacillus massiliensis]
MTNLLSALPGAAAQGLIWGIMAIGVFITYKVLDIADLTVDGSIATGGATCVMLTLAGMPVWAAMLCALAAGLLAGLVTGLLHTAMGIPALLSGILTQLSLYSINLRILGASNQSINVMKYDLLISLRYITTAICVTAIFVVVIIAILYWFFGTSLGCSIRATGANPNMSRAQGINVNMTKVIGLMLSNGLVALAGALLAQYQGFADVKMGIGSIVIGLAAVIIGDVIFSRIFRNFALKLLSVVLGAVIYYIVLQIVFAFGISSDYLKLLTAVIVAIFLAIPYWKGKYFGKRVRKEDRTNA